MKCIECNRNKATRKGFCESCLNEKKYAEGVNNGKAFLNLKRIKKRFVVKYQEGVNAESVASGNDLCPKKQERNLKKQAHSLL